jgi:hypothetical protein
MLSVSQEIYSRRVRPFFRTAESCPEASIKPEDLDCWSILTAVSLFRNCIGGVSHLASDLVAL